MTRKAKGLGNIASQNVTTAAQLLEEVYRLLEPLAKNEDMLRKEIQFLAARAQAKSAEAGRLLEATLRLSTGPLETTQKD